MAEGVEKVGRRDEEWARAGIIALGLLEKRWHSLYLCIARTKGQAWSCLKCSGNTLLRKRMNKGVNTPPGK